MIPHAPVLTVDVPDTLRVALQPVRSAAFQLRLAPADLAVVISPHGRTAGVYPQATGDLRGFGRSYTRDFQMSSCGFKRHPEAEEVLERAWGTAAIEGGMDHGLVVPCDLGGPLLDVPVIACTLPEVTGPSGSDLPTLHRVAGDLFRGIEELAERYRVAVVASAHLGAASTVKAPAGYRPGTETLDETFLETFEDDVGATTEVLDRLASDAASCGWGPLNVLAACLKGNGGKIHGYSRPLGVGYVVASVMAPGEQPGPFGPARAITTPSIGGMRGWFRRRRGPRA